MRHHQRRTTEHGQLLGEVAGLDGDLLQQLVNGVVTFGEKLEDPDAGRMPEGLEELGFRLVQGNTHDVTHTLSSVACSRVPNPLVKT